MTICPKCKSTNKMLKFLSTWCFNCGCRIKSYKQKHQWPKIIDIDKLLGECDMNYDYELVGWQSNNKDKCERF